MVKMVGMVEWSKWSNGQNGRMVEMVEWSIHMFCPVVDFFDGISMNGQPPENLWSTGSAIMVEWSKWSNGRLI